MMLKIKNRLYAGNEVVAKLISNDPDYTCWAAIYPIEKNELNSYPYLVNELSEDEKTNLSLKWVFRVLRFEVQSNHIENGWDVSEEEIINKKSAVVFSFDTLVDKLNEWGIDSDEFVEPWKTDYPL